MVCSGRSRLGVIETNKPKNNNEKGGEYMVHDHP